MERYFTERAIDRLQCQILLIKKGFVREQLKRLAFEIGLFVAFGLTLCETKVKMSS